MSVRSYSTLVLLLNIALIKTPHDIGYLYDEHKLYKKAIPIKTDYVIGFILKTYYLPIELIIIAKLSIRVISSLREAFVKLLFSPSI